MLLVYLPTVRSYLNLRRTFAEARWDLDRQLLVRQFEFFAVRQAAEYFDIAFAEDDSFELEAMAQGVNRSLDAIRAAAGTDTSVADRLDHMYSRLKELGQLAQEPADDSLLPARLKDFRDLMATLRNEQLPSLVDEILSQDGAAFEDRLYAISGRLLLMPFVELDPGRVLADAEEAVAAATFAQYLQRLIMQYQEFAFLDGAWHKLYLARGKAEQAYEIWLAGFDSSPETAPAIPDDRMREVSRSYRELNRMGDKFADYSEVASEAEALSFYQAEFEKLTDSTLSPALEDNFSRYENHLGASIKLVSRRIDLAGYSLAGFALFVATLALVSPWLMSRWIVKPVGVLTQATRRLGTGDLSGQVVVQSTDELGELAACFNQMVVDLKEAQDQLGRRERLVVLGQLAGSVAHEIRNPLGVMKNSIYFLRLTQKLKDQKAMQHLGLIEDEIIQANRILTELLDYARDPTCQVEPLILQEAFYRALAEVEVPESVNVEHELEDEPLNVMGDSGQITRVLANFLRNAVQAMPDGGVLSMVCRRDGIDMIAEVGDTGAGIADAEIDKIFEPLYTGKAKGIGLGLPLSLRYAKLNGGRIECESVVGEGSVFRLLLPASSDQGAEA